MKRFEGVDIMMIDEMLSDEEKDIRQTVRDWVEDRFLPVVVPHHREGTFPLELVPELGQLGVFGANIQGYGCSGVNNVAYGLMLQELERGDSGLRSFVSVQGGLVMYPILSYGSEEQKDYWLPRLATGQAIGCFGLTEPDFGSNPGGMKTRARKDGDHYVLNGAKMWITNGTLADVAVVWAKDDDNIIRGFLVEKGTPGFRAPEMKGKFSLRASVTSELVFEDVRIPARNLLPKSGGLSSPLRCLTQARYGIAWGALGAAMACYHAALEYSKERIQFGRPIGSFQLVQNKLSWMVTEITKGQLLVLQLGRLKDEGKMHHVQVSMAKMNNCNIALDIARVARDIHGANGILDEYPVIRHMLNMESVKTYEGTHDIHNLIIGRHITGLDAFGIARDEE
jgi:glutaryl-CoA dehydrogenase